MPYMYSEMQNKLSKTRESPLEPMGQISSRCPIGQAVSEKNEFEIVDDGRRRWTPMHARPLVYYKLTYEPLSQMSLKVKH